MTQENSEWKNITIRAPHDWIADLDQWIKTQPVPPKRTDVIRLAVAQFIQRNEQRRK